MASAGSYFGDIYLGDQWPPQQAQAQSSPRGARGGVVSKVGDHRPGVGVRRK